MGELFMAKTKYYAVKLGYTPGIFTTWKETQEQVKGYSGAVYKSFSTIEEAEEYLLAGDNSDSRIANDSNSAISNEDIDLIIKDLKDEDVLSFVDGSYQEVNGKPKVGFGAVLITNDATNNLYKAYVDSESLKSRNVTGEVFGARESILWSIKNNKENLMIFHDYEGIEKWATGEWSAKSEVAKQYKKIYDQASTEINIKFIKVKAHSGITYNEEADDLAKRALLDHGYKTYDDGSVYFRGFEKEDWIEIIKSLQEYIEEQDKLDYRVSETTKDYLKRIRVKYENERVTINCYNGAKSYVQGKQSFLLESLLSVAIEMLPDNEAVVEILNSYHAVDVNEINVEEKFNHILSDFPDKTADVKLRNTLYNAVFNTMLVIDLPDYTFLVTPIFRVFEYYLHEILNRELGQNTQHSNGSNNFAYFSKDTNGVYYYNSDSKSLNSSQISYLDELYNEYNKVRHVYSHWSSNSLVTAMIPTLEEAHERLKDGLTLINKYYKVF